MSLTHFQLSPHNRKHTSLIRLNTLGSVTHAEIYTPLPTYSLFTNPHTFFSRNYTIKAEIHACSYSHSFPHSSLVILFIQSVTLTLQITKPGSGTHLFTLSPVYFIHLPKHTLSKSFTRTHKPTYSHSLPVSLCLYIVFFHSPHILSKSGTHTRLQILPQPHSLSSPVYSQSS